MSELPNSPFELDIRFSHPLKNALFSLVRPGIKRLLGLDKMADLYESTRHRTPADFVEELIREMKLRIEIPENDLDKIPRSGPCIVVANHPYGGIEGIVLTALLRRARADAKVMANYLLEAIPELRAHFISVDPFDSDASVRSNIRGMKQSMAWLQGGGVLGVFPSGEVSSWQAGQGRVADPQWSPMVARLIHRSGASVVPVYFEGRNGWLFQLMGLIHPRLRTAMLPREFVNKRDKRLKIRIGSPIRYAKLASCEDPELMIDYLRDRTYLLKSRPADDTVDAGQAERISRSGKPLVDAVPAADLESDITQLPKGQKLVEKGMMQVCWGEAIQLPHVLRELGRLREYTFRRAGEGTGEAVDLDRYDRYYHHLFVWDGEHRRLVGAYRLGQMDRIVQQYGKKGLYTQSLFNYRDQLLERITPALEMGRSFVHPDYQKNFFPLMLLWKGIGEYVAKHPQYRYLFGPVSIDDRYEAVSRQLMINFLKANGHMHPLSELVKARKPFKDKTGREWGGEAVTRMLTDIDDVSGIIADIEAGGRGVPVLLKQYLKLGGKLLGFNVDPQFGNVVDGLIMVDLVETEPRLLARYMSPESMQRFLAFHGHNVRKSG